MRIDSVTIALRPRTPWEASDLGIALVRRHAARIWAAWVAVTLPVALLASAVGWLLDVMWLGAVLVWWLKPWFDRIPLYVLSRAVFGDTPGWRETARAQWREGWQHMLPWLTWRRVHPGRAMLLPVDALEQPAPGRRGERVRVLQRTQGSHAVMLWLVCMHLEAVIWLSILMLTLMFVPVEFLSDSARAMWETLFESPPAWAKLVLNLVSWIAMSVIEPFYVGAGFGLYLNRRTQLEAWDIELAFRRMAARLAQTALVLCLGIAVLTHAAPLRAADGAWESTGDAARAGRARDIVPAARADPSDPPSLEVLFGSEPRPGADEFGAAVKQAYRDPDLGRYETVHGWKPRERDDDDEATEPPPLFLRAIGAAMSAIAEGSLWILLALAAVALVWTRHRWLPLFAARAGATRVPDPLASRAVEPGTALPADAARAIRELYAAGEHRAAWGLFYRAGVARVAAALGTTFVPGTTESQSLRHARRLRDPLDTALFERIVARWREAAYADRVARHEELEALLRDWEARAGAGA